MIRPAVKEDCPALAELDSIASGGVLDYLFHDLVPGLTPVDIMAQALQGEYPPFSYMNAVVAALEGKIAGMVLSYPSSMHGLTTETREFFPAERLRHLSDFFSARVENSWYVDAIAVFPEYRRKGIGAKLMNAARERAEAHGFSQLSLITFADNRPAVALYRSLGYEVVRTVTVAGNTLIPHEGGCLLLRCPLNVA